MASGMATDLESILHASSSVTVLTGPAGTGKTACVVEFYRHFQTDTGQARCLLIVPNAPAKDYLRRQLLQRAGGVLFAPAITTFSALAARVLGQAGVPARKLTGVGRRLLLERVVRDLASAGGLKVLGGLVDTPGLVPALDQSIAELKRSAIAPEDLQRVIDRAQAKNADLLAVYQAYQQHLLAENRFDTEGLLWLARDVLRQNPQADFGWDVRALAVDGFIDFTPTQLEMLALLAGRTEKTLITLPHARQERRQRLWQWTQRTLDELTKTLPCAVIESTQPSTLDGLFDLSVLTGATKDAAASAGEAKWPEVRILSAGGAEAEIRSVATAIKADLLSGVAGRRRDPSPSAEPRADGARGPADPTSHRAAADPTGTIGVLVRSLEGYEESIARIFAEFDIPIAERPRPLDESPVIRFLLGVLALPPRYLMPDVLTAIGSSYFDPGLWGEYESVLAQVACMAVRAGNVLEGRRNYANAFDRLVRLSQRRQEAMQEEQDDSDVRWPMLAESGPIQQASAMLAAVFDLLDSAATVKDASAFAAAVRQIIAKLDLSGQVAKLPDDRMVAAQLRALGALEEVLAELERSKLAGAWEELLALLNRLVKSAAAPPARVEELVSVLDVLDARAMRFDRVYLLGLNEKAFPQLSSERCFIDEADRYAWTARGLRLDRRSDLLGREMLLFYLACTRAREFLQISFATSDSSGASRSPSTFAEEFMQACRWQGVGVATEKLSPGQIVPPPDRIACPQDVLNAAVLNAFDARGDEVAARTLLAALAHRDGPLLRQACYGIFATHRRWKEGEVDEFDGRLNEPALIALLAERLKSSAYSASELQSFAKCPWQFLARYVLRLEELPEPSAQLTPLQRGAFFHAVLWRVMTTLRERQGGAVDLAKVEEAEVLAVLEQAVEAERSQLAPLAAYEELWRVETAHWSRQLAKYLLAERENSGRQGVYFELGFGLGGQAGKRSDPASRKDAVEIELGERRVRLVGKIDRVDVDAGGRTVIVDYKSGHRPGVSDMIAGLDMQLGLYSVAVEKLLGKPCAGGEYHGLRDCSYTHFRMDKVTPARNNVEHKEFPALLKDLLATARRYLDAMEQGQFDALPASSCAQCAYRCICQFSPTRSQRKSGGHHAMAAGPEDADE